MQQQKTKAGSLYQLVQSDYRYLGFVLPALTYIPILFWQRSYHVRQKTKQPRKKNLV